MVAQVSRPYACAEVAASTVALHLARVVASVQSDALADSNHCRQPPVTVVPGMLFTTCTRSAYLPLAL